jgi:hypothetical protein
MNAGYVRRIVGAMAVAGLSCVIVAAPCQAAIESRDILKTYFETGDIPNQDDFADLIDSSLNLVLNSGSGIEFHTVDLDAVGGIAGDGSGNALRMNKGDIIDSALNFIDDGLFVGGSSDWPGQSGYLGLQFELPDATGLGPPTTHYGFVQMSVDSATSSTPYAIRIYGFAYEGDPDQPIIVAQIVPEPSTAALVIIGLIGWAVCRRASGSSIVRHRQPLFDRWVAV